MSGNLYPDLGKGQPPPQGYPQQPQGYQQPPPQGYQPPPGGYPNQPPPPYAPGYPAQQPYPAQPQPGYPAQPYAPAAQAQAQPAGHTIIIQHGAAGRPVSAQRAPPPKSAPYKNTSSTLGGLFSGASKVAKSIGNTVQKELDIHASSPTLSLFATGAILQFVSRKNNQCLRTLPNGALDCVGNPAVNDPYTHYRVQNFGHNIVTLNCMGNPTFHIFIDKAGNVFGNGPAGFESKLRLHETMKGFITFESLHNPGCHVGITPEGLMKPGKSAGKDEDSQFSIRVIVAAQQPVQPAKPGKPVQPVQPPAPVQPMQQTTTVIYH